MNVLIESDWNLKTPGGSDATEDLSVLIESDWNLKFGVGAFIERRFHGINRIRLEFKVFGASGGHLLGGGY